MPTKTSFFHNKSFCNSYSFSTIIADCVRIFGLQQDWQKLIIFYIGSAKSEASVNFCGWFLFASKVTCILHHNHENLATINKDLQNLKIHKILSQSNWIEEYRQSYNSCAIFYNCETYLSRLRLIVKIQKHRFQLDVMLPWIPFWKSISQSVSV